MALPENFAQNPKEGMHRSFRNICIDFKKAIHSVKDPNELRQEGERFIHATMKLDWNKQNPNAYKKDDGEKAVGKVWREFNRYVKDLESPNSDSNPQDLLDALAEVERLVGNFKFR